MKQDKSSLAVFRLLREHRKASAALAVVLCVLVAGGLYFFSGRQEKQEEAKAPLVKTMTVGEGALEESNTYSGTVKGRYETNLAFQVGGQITARNVNVGSRVQAGEVLMTINPKDVVQQVNQGSAQVSAARAQLDLAQRNLSRYTELYQQDAVPATVLDQYQTNYDAAFAQYQNALAQSAESQNALGYTNLIAGAPGVISQVVAEEGQVVAAGQTVMTLVQTDELEVEISVPENRVAALAEGQEVTVRFWALKGVSTRGVVREIAPMADSAARTYRVRVSVPQPPQGMELGMTASVDISDSQSGASQGIRLPLSAIYQTGDTPQVWVVGEDGKVSLHPVQVASFDGDEAVVDGLEAGMVVVTAGVHRLTEGQDVRTEASI
jgi:multidrug efflux system membrane fusion protein